MSMAVDADGRLDVGAQDDGKHLVVWRKTETGDWKAAADTFNINRPAQ